MTQLTGQTLTNSGYIQGNSVDLTARQDIHNVGGRLRGDASLSLLAGRDIVSQTTARTDGTERWLDRPAGIYVQAPNGMLTLSALNDITLSATDINHAGDNGTSRLQAGNDLRLNAVTTRHSEYGDWGVVIPGTSYSRPMSAPGSAPGGTDARCRPGPHHHRGGCRRRGRPDGAGGAGYPAHHRRCHH
ncbi:hypothetical protein MAY82_12225 [Edwardsiella ictaluri]|nr:hypothetical protein [Edwardsiella ictaluri]WFO11990.1 hypothetical protein MAY82_12225 [Edwardsiella ictaluri]